MQYVKLLLTIEPNEEYVVDLLASSLGEAGFESFEVDSKELTAYIPLEKYDKNTLENLLETFPYASTIEHETSTIDQQNWNEEWEKHYFEPIVIDNRCVIHSSFHRNVPQLEYDIVIDPKMSFGTGHHETTSLMIGEILAINLEGKSLLDMGCGTAVLAILAAKRGAHPVVGIDIDPWCTENSTENIHANGVEWIEIELGDSATLANRKFDVIFANINRNILLEDMASYSACLNKGGVLYMSGFYTSDIPILNEEALRNGLLLESSQEKNQWAVVKTVKQ